MRISYRLLITLTFFYFIAGCFENAVENNARDLFYRLTPECSAGEHFLPAPEDARSFVWLFGANNNGRHEENILIEQHGQSARIRAFWHTDSGELICCESEITAEQFAQLQTELLAEEIIRLPNLVPDVSHGMTYWVKYDDGLQNHEACAYCINLDSTLIFNRSERSFATKWKNSVEKILRMRLLARSEWRLSGFDEQGNVKWDGQLIPEKEIESDQFN